MTMEVETIRNSTSPLEDDTMFSSTSGIRSSSIAIDPNLSLSDMVPSVIELCKDLFGKWSEMDSSSFSVETISGGITNLLLKVSVRLGGGEEDVSLTIRLYGPNTEYLINRERELRAIVHLSAAGFGARLLGIFENGVVQSFIHARTLTPADMRRPKLAAGIARELRRFHDVEIPGSREPQLWNDVVILFQKASTLKFNDQEKHGKYATISFSSIDAEILELKELTSSLNAPVVFAHNDLLCGNIMVNDSTERLHLIDFEYGSYNYRGFDIGNHFNEYAGYDCDYSLYPSKEEQLHFIMNYVMAHGVPPREVELEAVYVESDAYALASHLYWGLWALIQAATSPIDFDYMSYFFLRYHEYKRRKRDSLRLLNAYLESRAASLQL